MTGQVRLLAVGAIAEDALGRDRSGLDGAAMEELKVSILRGGVRLPVEVFALAEPRGERVWGLVSGFRRLQAVRALGAMTGQARFATIPALVRPRAETAAAMAAMVAENEVREGVSAWGRGRIAVAARDAGAWATVEAAVAGLYPCAGQAKRGRLRALARLAEALEGALPDPEGLSERQALALGRAVQDGHGPMLRAAFAGAPAAAQGRVLAEVLADVAAAEAPVEAARGVARRWTGRRAGRAVVARLVVRRERLLGAWAFTVTGPEASEALAAAMMDWVRAAFAPG